MVEDFELVLCWFNEMWLVFSFCMVMVMLDGC